MDCRDCARHDAETGRCLDGKVNPRRYEHALGVVQVLGLRAICVFNDHRERLVGVHQLESPTPKAASELD
jgi:hypothetical protein